MQELFVKIIFYEFLTDWIHVWKRHILCGHGIQEC